MNVIEDGNEVFFKKSELIRMPVRLGQNAFYGEKLIPPESVNRLVNTMIAFKHLMLVQDVVDYRACATSALRDAKNGMEVAAIVSDKSGINIEIINGVEEAELVYSNKVAEMFDDNKPYLYVDVGGGSTEMTLFARRKVIVSNSINIGTIRLLNNQFAAKDLSDMKNWLQNLKGTYKDLEIIGSGGNINKIFKLSGKKEGKAVSYKEFKKLYKYLYSFSENDRIKILGFNPDRADVIIPASEIFLNIMKWTKANKILVPKIGISDGIIHQLYTKYINAKERTIEKC